MSSSKRCLVVLSGEERVECARGAEGAVSAYSFIQAFGLLSRAHLEVCVTTPGGKRPRFQYSTEEERAWIQQNDELVAAPVDLALVNGSDWDALVLPSSMGAVVDLVASEQLGKIILTLVQAKKPVCAIGFGMLGLAKALQGPQAKWVFEGYNVSGCSNMELARLPYFAKLPAMPEEMVHDLGGQFVASDPDVTFVCVDRLLISAQNASSTTLAVLNLIWLCNG